MKKRNIVVILASLLIAVMAIGMVTACGKATIGGDKETSAAAQETVKNITFKATANEGGLKLEIIEQTTFEGKTLGDYLRQNESCEWEESEYGIFVKGFDGIKNDDSQELWWQLFVNGESAQVGADMIELTDGGVYEYVYTKGYDW